MKTKLLAVLLMAGGSLFARTHVVVRAGVGVAPFGYVAPPMVTYAAPPAVAYAAPCPGAGYTFVAGYWDFVGGHRFWHAGHWARR
jgi:hypothetical protein